MQCPVCVCVGEVEEKLEVVSLMLVLQVCKGGGSGTGRLVEEIKHVDSVVCGGLNAVVIFLIVYFRVDKFKMHKSLE